MEQISIKTSNDTEIIRNIFKDRVSFLREEGLYIDCYTDREYKLNTITYKIDKQKSTITNYEDIFKMYMANGILDIIMNLYQEDIVKRSIINDVYHLNIEEIIFVKEKIIEDIYNQDYIEVSSNLYRENIRNKILMTIMEYLQNSIEINIAGFINFRLKFYIDYIESITQKNIEEFMMDKEYKDFVKILKHFIDIQEPQVDSINVFMEEDKYRLIDSDNNILNSEYLEEIASELSDIDISYDDLLISSLITIAPKEVIIHTQKDKPEKEVISVIKSVFEDKVTICKTSK